MTAAPHYRIFVRSLTALLLSLVGMAAAPARSLAQQDTTRIDRWDGSAELSYTDQSAERSIRLLTAGFSISHLLTERYELSASTETRYGRADDEVIARNHHATLAFDFQPRETLSPFVFAEVERDRPRRLNLRASGGAGAKYTLFRGPAETDEASVSLALLSSYQNFGEADDEPARADRVRARWSLRARGSRELRPGLSVRQLSLVQPVWDDASNYLLRSESGLKMLLMEKAALSVVYQLTRNSEPPLGVEANERILKTGLILDF